jgi:predicted metalloprotease with PDZ domain
LLDAEIRMSTDGQKSLDDVLRTLYEKYANGPGYSAEDFRNVCSEIAGKDLTAFFERSVNSTDELDYQPAATWFGLNIGPFKPLDESKAAEEEAADPSGNASAEESASASSARRVRGVGRVARGQQWLGLSTRDTDGQSIVTSVIPESPADLAGISLDDEVIALEGMRVKGGVDSLLRLYNVGDTVKLMIAREQRIIEVPVEISTRDFSFWSLSSSGDDNRDRKKRRELWISGEVPKEPAAPKKSEKPKSDNDL